MVPMPCATPTSDFAEIEPNDTPDHATDACTVTEGYWGTFAGVSDLGGDDEVDYIVFRTPVAARDTTIPVNPCWNTEVDLVDVYVYEVVDQTAVEPPVYESATDDMFCEGEFGVMLASDTVYLLELRLATPGTPTTVYEW